MDRLIYNIDEHDVRYDMNRLMTTDGLLSGLLTIKYYMLIHMLAVKVASKGTFQQKYVNFYDVHNDIDRLCREYHYLDKAVCCSMNDRAKFAFEYHIYAMYRLYYGCVSIFKPIIAKRLVETFKPSVVLDPCAGWGSRMIGCVAGGCDRYVGFDTNRYLENKYQKMITELNLGEKVRMVITDCMEVNYSLYDYDMLLTSPPYFNTEVYDFSPVRSKDEWREWYHKVFTMWWNGLRSGGVMALAIPFSVYPIAVAVAGDCDDAWRLNNVKRCENKQDTELLFIWVK